MIGPFIRALLRNKERSAASIYHRRRRQLPLTTGQWLGLTLGIAALVGALFMVALLYLQPGR